MRDRVKAATPGGWPSAQLAAGDACQEAEAKLKQKRPPTEAALLWRP
jgi:hypothetical protein